MVITTYEKCPQCGGPYETGYDCNTSKKEIQCLRCGRRQDFTIVKNNGEPVLNENGEPKYLAEEVRDGYGCTIIRETNNILTIHTFNDPWDLEEAKRACQKICEDFYVDESRSHFTYWDAEKKEIVAILGEEPGTYEQFMLRVFGKDALDKKVDKNAQWKEMVEMGNRLREIEAENGCPFICE